MYIYSIVNIENIFKIELFIENYYNERFYNLYFLLNNVMVDEKYLFSQSL